MKNPLDLLAKELETLEGKGIDTKILAKKARNTSYPRDLLIRDLREAKLEFFSEKVKIGYYEMVQKLQKEKDGKTNN